MVQTIEQGDIFGRIGKNIGEGVAQQVERSALASRLKGIQGFPQQAADLISSPGGREILPQVMPYLQNAAIAKEAEENASNRNVQNRSNLPGGQSASNEIPTTSLRLKSTPEDIREGGRRYLKATPLRFGNDPLKAEAQYQKDVDNQTQQINEVNKYFDSASKEVLQKDPTGEVLNKFREQAENAALAGKMTGSEAGREFSKKMLDFDKSRAKQVTQGTSWYSNLFSNAPLKQLHAARNAYKEAGLPEVFRDDLIAHQKLSGPGASEIAFPLSKGDSEFFSNVKPVGKITGGDEKAYQKTIDRIGEDTSLLNFALQLSRKGYDPQRFLDLVASSEKPLTPRQNRELQQREELSFLPSLGDMLYGSFTKPKKLAYF